MNRREFSSSTASVLALSALGLPLVMPTTAQAQQQFKEGKEYVRLSKAAPVEAPAQQQSGKGLLQRLIAWFLDLWR